MQSVIGVRVCGKPVLAVDLLPVGLEPWVSIVAFAYSDALTVRFDNLQIAVVDPDLSFEVALVGHQLFRLHGEGIAADFVQFFASQVGDVVVANFRGRKHERLHIPQILFILRRQNDVPQRDDGCVHHLLHALAFGAEDDIRHDLPLATGGVAARIQFFHLDRLPVGVVVARIPKLRFLRGKFLDDLSGIDVGCGAHRVGSPHGHAYGADCQ